MKVKAAVLALALGVVLLLPSVTFASLIGDTIFGELHFGGYPLTTNFWDPVNGYVPGGSGPQPNAIVNDPDVGYVEFQMEDSVNGLYGDVDAFTIDIHEFPQLIPGGLNSWNIHIGGLDNLGPLTGYSVLFSNFAPGSLTINVTAHDVYFSFIGGDQIAEGREVKIQLEAIPEPGTMLLLGAGLLGLGSRRLRR
jgi:hypothetical protein